MGITAMRHYRNFHIEFPKGDIIILVKSLQRSKGQISDSLKIGFEPIDFKFRTDPSTLCIKMKLPGWVCLIAYVL